MYSIHTSQLPVVAKGFKLLYGFVITGPDHIRSKHQGTFTGQKVPRYLKSPNKFEKWKKNILPLYEVCHIVIILLEQPSSNIL
jgi:hypothetical protein